jgi:uncharacterized membrane protein AbrB (regulator of aidB expression)
MATLARDLGAHEQTVAIVHTLRVLAVSKRFRTGQR